MNSLERSGYRAEAFAPRESGEAAGISATANSQNGRQESESGSGSRGGSSDPQQDHFSQNPGNGQQQQRRDPRQPKWIDELENQQ